MKWQEAWHRWRRMFGHPAGNDSDPVTARHGRLGERAARRYLEKAGLRFLRANYRGRRRGEIDLVMLDGDCLVFAEVKARSSEAWARPSRAVSPAQKQRLTRMALDYLRSVHTPRVKVRFDIVEVLLEDSEVREIRHLDNAFPFSRPYRYG